MKQYSKLSLPLQEEEARIAQEELEERVRIAAEREEEARRLQNELEEARSRMEEQQREIQVALATPAPMPITTHIQENEAEENDDEKDEYGGFEFSIALSIITLSRWLSARLR